MYQVLYNHFVIAQHTNCPPTIKVAISQQTMYIRITLQGSFMLTICALIFAGEIFADMHGCINSVPVAAYAWQSLHSDAP